MVALRALARLGQRGRELLDARTRVAQVGLEPAALLARGPLLRQLGLYRVDLLARGAQLGERGARLLELCAQMLLCLRGSGKLALEPLSQLARLGQRAARPLPLLARLLCLRAHLVEHPPGVRELVVELRDAGCRPRCLAASLLELRRRSLEGALQVVGAPERGLDGIGDLAGGDGGRLGGDLVRGLLLREHGGRQLDQRAERDDRAGREILVLEPRLAAHRGVDPVDDRAVAALKLLKGVAARRGDLERLEEAVELEALAHPDRDERELQLDLRAVLAARHGLDHPAELGKVAGHRERLDERAPEHAGARPAEELLGGPAPARYGAVAIRKDEAGIDELAQQLLDSLRLGGRGTRLLLGHVSPCVGRRPRQHKPRAGSLDRRVIAAHRAPPGACATTARARERP